MAVAIVRLGSPREPREGLQISTVRRPPRGVAKEEYATGDLYDVWFPNLSPSQELFRESCPIGDEAGWRTFRRRFLAEVKAPHARRDLDLLAALSHQANFAVGCYCKDESHWHRALLRALLEERDAGLSDPVATPKPDHAE